ncbi:MAG: translation elongation factor 4 [Candidatus Pacebacteria bacterium]|nr:translation elongation factor 4 [Candidatus Paceibacterota bacterium]
MTQSQIRNFSIIAHIDHGKSTLADRLLEVTKTIEKRKMKAQVLDSMDLERERGITIKMQPVRILYEEAGENYLLNLIDTPGHIDFSYEVSRALQAVEGVLLLVDATQGVQAQTFTVLSMAQDLGLTIIPVINKIDLPNARVEETVAEIKKLLPQFTGEILSVSGKTGEGVERLLQEIVQKIPPPQSQYHNLNQSRSLVFDFEYSTHRGVIVYARVLDGEVKMGQEMIFAFSREKFIVQEVGMLTPTKEKTDKLSAGQIGYIVTGIKNAENAAVGDTITTFAAPLPAVPGYERPRPVVWASVYPESQDDFNLLRQALLRLRLSDSSLSFEEESSGILGRGFRTGFLGMLHLEIITERLRREFGLKLVIATPTTSYELTDLQTGEVKVIYSPHLFPQDTKGYTVRETWVKVKIIVPPDYLSGLVKLFHDHEVISTSTDSWSDNRTALDLEMPLRELMRNFFDEVKSATAGYASLSYELGDFRPADVVRLDILVGGEVVPAFTRIIARRRAETEGRSAVNRLKDLMPRQLIVIKLQAEAMGRIIASESLSALRKDVTGYLYGGDVTRKMKLLEKQKKGKKKMQQRGRVDIPEEVFLKMMVQENKGKA